MLNDLTLIIDVLLIQNLKLKYCYGIIWYSWRFIPETVFRSRSSHSPHIVYLVRISKAMDVAALQLPVGWGEHMPYRDRYIYAYGYKEHYI